MKGMKTQRRCKNKECNRVLPDDYKYKYCESCMNKNAHKAKNILATTLGVALFIVTLGHFGGKK